MTFTIAHTDYGFIEEKECNTLRVAINHLFDLFDEFGIAKRGIYEIGHSDNGEWVVDFKISTRILNKLNGLNGLI